MIFHTNSNCVFHALYNFSMTVPRYFRGINSGCPWDDRTIPAYQNFLPGNCTNSMNEYVHHSNMSNFVIIRRSMLLVLNIGNPHVLIRFHFQMSCMNDSDLYISLRRATDQKRLCKNQKGITLRKLQNSLN